MSGPITREDLVASKLVFVCHVDGSDFYANHYRNETYPRLTGTVSGPRRRRSKVEPGKSFFVDGVRVTSCSELLERLNKPQLAVVGGRESASAGAP
ncbi:hypothetical protein IVB45_17300 [Bradyrhizobium sp. 4]|uniref:hypothetical protein n=1 Tax=unclassified Bradyrhizobium TaxID=2631580 RepID=UPI001FF97851|nr:MULTISPECIES: hypothetical protein [unclassified Bradyrhizobium]MCK1402068.1 hypothetical protein [Bradyrhizobium sp. 39]MCK1751212.1 hypothetical protein [Bradyrhizobium sp. 135]UPJ38468.1 hypothetical protein IVB45_17300 [Bradyrhizobium sp. 4]